MEETQIQALETITHVILLISSSKIPTPSCECGLKYLGMCTPATCLQSVENDDNYKGVGSRNRDDNGKEDDDKGKGDDDKDAIKSY
jgi:hypothetical protein